MKYKLFLLFTLFLINESFAQTTSPRPTLPSNPFSNSAIFDLSLNQFDFHYEGSDGSLKFEYRPDYGGSFQSLQCLVNGSYNFHPSNSGGMGMIVNNSEVFPWSNGVQYELVGVETSEDTLMTFWQMKYESNTITYTYRIHITGRTLVIEVTGEDSMSQAFYLDRSEETSDPVIINVPYLTLFNVLFTNDTFVSFFFDWEKTNGSQLHPSSEYFSNTSAYFAQNVYYNPNTAGERRIIDETIYLTVSPKLQDVLPNVPNPTSIYKSTSADKLIFDLWTYPFSTNRQYIEQLQNAGLKNLWVINHNWQYGGYDNMLPDVLPANPSFGGDTGLQAVSRAAKDAGYLFALHENYIDFYPNAPSWNPGHISLNSDGSMRKGWYNASTGIQSFQLKPSLAQLYMNIFSPVIHSAYSTSASYLDVHSGISPSGAVDYDDAEPSWGSFLETLQFYRQLGGRMRQIHNGPVSGEGYTHFLHVGYYDDIEAQINSGYGDERSQGYWLPLLLDFDLLKLHEKAVVHGVGYYERFFSHASGEPDYRSYSLDSTLQYIATELAYGHGGFITTPQMSMDYLKVAQLENRHVLTTQRLYAHADVVKIQYNAHGELIDVSEYIKRYPNSFSDIYNENFMSQVRVEYDNGVIVCVNRHPTREWNVNLGDVTGWYNFHAIIDSKDSLAVGNISRTDYQLPAGSGWVVYSPDAPTNVNSEFSNQLFTLSQNYPNPFNPSTTINYSITKRGFVQLKVYDILGNEVTTLVNEEKPMGNYEIKFNASSLSSGVYFYRLQSGNFSKIKKLILLR